MAPEIINTTPFPIALTVRERPILFSAPMVRALLAGTKTQTRRVLKPQPEPCQHQAWPGDSAPNWVSDEDGWHCASCGNGVRLDRRRTAGVTGIRCPYGVPGDRLWVREAWARTHVLQAGDEWVVYREGDNRTDYGGPWKPGIHMFRRDSRILLEVTDVRVERLQDISEADAIAEGAPGGHGAIPGYAYSATPIEHYRHIWNAINGTDAWAANPWVWAVSFRSLPSSGSNSVSLPQGSTAPHRRERS